MYLSFYLGGNDLFAIEQRKVERVLADTGIYRLPRQKDDACGVIEYRRVLVPVFDFRRILPETFANLGKLPHLILFYGNESLNAFLAEAIETISRPEVVPAPEPAFRFILHHRLLYLGENYLQLDLKAIEEVLNIP